jgi:NTE family protein
MRLKTSRWLFFVAAALLAGCASVANQPINQFVQVPYESLSALPDDGNNDTTIIGLGFSGGGARSAAFAYGVLQQLERTPVPGEPQRSMLDLVRFISGVSGGAIAAAYVGIKGRHNYHDFREKYLIRDSEETMRTHVGAVNLLRAMRGGVNTTDTFAAWLDRNVFDGAKFADMWKPGRPIVWINASDLYNRVPFVFNYHTLAALCTDLGKLPVAEAVAASAAAPVVFSPIVIKSYTGCDYTEPSWLRDSRDDPQAPSALRQHIAALDSYRDPERLKYVKLVDGGMTDDFGVSGLTLARAAAKTPYAPFTPQTAVRLERVIYMVADAGLPPSGDWAQKVEGPNLVPLMVATASLALETSVREGYDSFRAVMKDWEEDLIAYRCGLSASEVVALRGSLDGWDCHNLKFYITEVGADNLDPETRAKFEDTPTRLSLPIERVDAAIAAGSQALRDNSTWNEALDSMKARSGLVAAN